MIISEFNNIQIKGVSVAVPEQKVDVTAYTDTFGEESVKKFIQNTGVKSIHRANNQQTASDLGYAAARDVMEKTGVDREEIGALIFVTQKPDYRIPSTSFVLHKRLGLSEDCVVFDLNLACSGYVYGLQTIMAMMQTSDKKTALLITGDTSVRTLSPQDRTMIMLFGDSGTATVLKKVNDEIYSRFAMRTDGKRFKSIITPAGAYRNRDAPLDRTEWGDGIIRSDYDTHMKGMDVFGFSITDVPKLMKEFMKNIQTDTDSYDYFTLHQANIYILNQIARRLKIPKEKVLISLDRFGNNSSNSIPLVWADHFGDKHKGVVRVFLSGFGAGLSWAVADLSIQKEAINPIIYTDEFFEN
jgi:3-oxoacyl-[acyl-carrier-protein] synthase-3